MILSSLLTQHSVAVLGSARQLLADPVHPGPLVYCIGESLLGNAPLCARLAGLQYIPDPQHPFIIPVSLQQGAGSGCSGKRASDKLRSSGFHAWPFKQCLARGGVCRCCPCHQPLSSALIAVHGVLRVEGPAEEESPGTGIPEWGLGTEGGDKPETLVGEAEEVGTPCTTGTPPRLRPWTDHSPAHALDGSGSVRLTNLLQGPVRLTNLLQARRAAFGELPLCAAEKSGMRCAAHAVRCTGRHCCRRLLLSLGLRAS